MSTAMHTAPTVLTYAHVHHQLKRLYGRAAEYECRGCGGQAKQWAYNHSGIAEVSGWHCGARVTYSQDVTQYVPLCLVCHINRDKNGGQGWATCAKM